MSNIHKNYSNDQLNTIREAQFKVGDAFQALNDLNEEMRAAGDWKGQADIARAANDLKALFEEGGSMHWMAKEL